MQLPVCTPGRKPDPMDPARLPDQPMPTAAAPAKEQSVGRPAALSNPERWVEEHGDYLFHFALSRVRDVAKAEDLVQETFLAALKGGKSFAGRSAEKSWLVGILKNKVSDHFRKASRETSFTDLEFYQDEETGNYVADGLLKGEWKPTLGPREWQAEPGAALDSEAFWQAFHQCADKLPKAVSAAFRLRELDEVDTKEICQILSISEANLWVMLHRARMALRRCLEVNWFRKLESGPSER